jgi:hypothetical protein
MYARISRWEGGDADAIRESAQRMSSEASSGPPEGVPAKGFTYLIDPDNGRTLAIGLFETEEDLRKGDETLNQMNPTRDDAGSRTSVEMYEVPIDIRL